MIANTQLDTVVNSTLVDYGVLGIGLLLVGYFAWHLFKTQQNYADEWRREARENGQLFVELSQKQTMIQEKQTEIQDRQTSQTKDFYDSIHKRMDDLPIRVVKEMEFQKSNRGIESQKPEKL